MTGQSGIPWNTAGRMSAEILWTIHLGLRLYSYPPKLVSKTTKGFLRLPISKQHLHAIGNMPNKNETLTHA
jgi:hypothetical protein